MKNKKSRLSPKDRQRAVELLKRFHRLGRTLAEVDHPLRLHIRPRKKLLELCIEAGVTFADEAAFRARADEETRHDRA